MQKALAELKSVRVTALFLGIYFLLLPFDFYQIGSIGTISKLAALFPIALCIFSQLSYRHKLLIKLNAITKWGLAHVFVVLLSLIISVSFSTSKTAVITLVTNMGMVVLMGSYRYDKCETEWLERCLVLSGWVTAFLMMAFSSFSQNRMTFGVGDNTKDSNYLCGFMLYAFCYYFKKLIETKKFKYLIPLALFLILQLRTGSRGALLAFIVVAVSSVLISDVEAKSKRNVLFGIVVIVAVVWGTWRFIIPRINPLITERYTTAYLQQYGTVGRTNIWQYLLDKYAHSNLLRQILGYGYGTTHLVNEMAGVSSHHVAHNLYIDNLISAGFLGVLTQVCFQISCLKSARRANKPIAICTFLGYIAMCMSLSMTSYKPLWALVIMIMIYENEEIKE